MGVRALFAEHEESTVDVEVLYCSTTERPITGLSIFRGSNNGEISAYESAMDFLRFAEAEGVPDIRLPGFGDLDAMHSRWIAAFGDGVLTTPED